MAKEKFQTVETKKNERIFHYEILGIILFVLTIFTIAKLGVVGKYLMITVKVLFGDWYFLIVLLTMAYSIRCILIHQKLKISNIRYLGIFLIILALILLSHFTMHKYVRNYSQNYLKLTLSLYFNYFKTNQPSAIVGGGIIGALIFYLFYFLFSEVGVILLSIILCFIGTVFITKKTIKDFVKMVFGFFKKIFKKVKKASNFVQNTIDSYDSSYQIKKIKYHVYPTNNETEYKNASQVAKMKANDLKMILNQLNIFYTQISYLVCRNATMYFISSHYTIQISKIQPYLRKIFNNYLVKYDNIKRELILEVSNDLQMPLRVSEIEKASDEEVCFGIDDRNQFLNLEYDNNKLIVFGKSQQQIGHYFDSIIIDLMHTKQNLNYYFIDLTNTTQLSSSTDPQEINHVINIINERIDKINKAGFSSINKYNSQAKNPEIGEVVIIHGIDKFLNSDAEVDKIKYILQTTNQYGFIYLFSVSSENSYVNQIVNLFDYKLFLDNKLSYSNQVIGFQRFDLINPDYEGYLAYKNIIIRMTILLLQDKEYQSIKNRY